MEISVKHTKQYEELIVMTQNNDVEMVVRSSDIGVESSDAKATNVTCKATTTTATNDDVDVDLAAVIGVVKKAQESDKTKQRRVFTSLIFGIIVGFIIGILVLNISKRFMNNQGNLVAFTHEQAVCFHIRPRPPPLPGKKGVALRMSDRDGTARINLPIIQSLRPYWNYAWHLPRSVLQPDDIEYVPMLWGSTNVDEAKRRIDTYVLPHIRSGKVKRILGYNEPDAATQANMTVESAVEIWSALEYANVSLTSPSCVHPTNDWMKSFMQQATSACKRVDWVGVHWYGPANFAMFKHQIRQAFLQHGKRKLLITEFAVADFNATSIEDNSNTREEVLLFMKQALPWIERRPWIAGYAWFSFKHDDPRGWSSALYNRAGALTQLGKYYASVRTETPTGDYSISIWNGNKL